MTTQDPPNAHFTTANTWAEARALLTFQPLRPRRHNGAGWRSLRIHVRDHRNRTLPPENRTLEITYDSFTLSQAWKGLDNARHWALAVRYGRDGADTRINGHAGRMYSLGPNPAPDDIDGRSPSVVAWHDGGLFCLLSSDTLAAEELHAIAKALYLR